MSNKFYILFIVNNNMKKVISVLFLLVISGVLTSAATHTADQFWINVDGTDMTLQYAIDVYDLSRDLEYKESSNVFHRHDINEIWVETGYSGYKTLLEALQSKNFEDNTTTTLSDKLFYHNANEILLSDGRNLRDALNSKSIGCFDDFNNNVVCNVNLCIKGMVQCNGDCEGTIPEPVGTPCEGSNICDGAGSCGCISQASYSCSDNDIYWYDSCEVRGLLKTDCGVDSCTVWGDYICTDGTLTRTRTCTNYYCNDGACSSYTRSSTQTTDSCGGKVICTEMYETGLMDKETYELDLKYAKEHFSNEALKGYRSWGIPVVKAMRNNQDSMEVVVPMVDAFMEEIKYSSGKTEVSNEIGAYYLDEAIPLFERIGILIDDPNWETLFDKSSWAVKQIKLIRRVFEKENPNNKIVEDYFTEEKVAEMFYVALGDKTEPDMEFTIVFINELKKAVEEIELLIANQ